MIADVVVDSIPSDDNGSCSSQENQMFIKKNQIVAQSAP